MENRGPQDAGLSIIIMTRDHLPALFHYISLCMSSTSPHSESLELQESTSVNFSHGLGGKAVDRQTCPGSASQPGQSPRSVRNLNRI